jgi:hypothetical protein
MQVRIISAIAVRANCARFECDEIGCKPRGLELTAKSFLYG